MESLSPAFERKEVLQEGAEHAPAKESCLRRLIRMNVATGYPVTIDDVNEVQWLPNGSAIFGCAQIDCEKTCQAQVDDDLLTLSPTSAEGLCKETVVSLGGLAHNAATS